ncbi:LysR family transcriptional regulator [Sphingopyxis alaskensis]|jgi:LysR family transcriptional regulator of beta-lactamase|uniref:Transcriptional regulator, LysR family n=1 Tax=Sphingopyxis alaskensis (strain DSM 13593 / LMG 18877 / RB2256) TaxID=317655 RepID=Q1GRV7_SPHAL|nr:LysR family transcriptional regulator [Sphingopyxis alaskensis]ABF53615.1 transcriptional regulator, LysR family [Sphingopyxis alaskensis RB2256]MCM3419114.1 LysR family transcriptional regulator [Sphingopyxis alaskensis]
MDRAQLPLNALRAFEAAARHLNFTRAGLELCVSQGAVSHQVAALERRLGTRLFHRLPRGLALTDEGHALVPVVSEAFDRVAATLDQYADGRFRETLKVGVVGTFATGWLMPRLDAFSRAHPSIDLRIATNNNRVDLAGEGLDYAIRFGDGAWHGTHAEPLLDAPMAPICAPVVAARLRTPADLASERLLRSYRADEWALWFGAAGIAAPVMRGPVFDSSALMAAAAAAGQGVALAPPSMFTRELAAELLVQPFAIAVDTGRYWLTRLMSRAESEGMLRFRAWLFAEVAAAGA